MVNDRRAWSNIVNWCNGVRVELMRFSEKMTVVYNISRKINYKKKYFIWNISGIHSQNYLNSRYLIKLFAEIIVPKQLARTILLELFAYGKNNGRVLRIIKKKVSNLGAKSAEIFGKNACPDEGKHGSLSLYGLTKGFYFLQGQAKS